MDPNMPGTNYDASALGHARRKRGRPRKYSILDDHFLALGDNAWATRDLNMNAGGNLNEPSGFLVNGSQTQPVGSVRTSNDITIGQVVSGFIEASFDGGYVLALRAGNSEATLRGVVFKHGRYVPVSAETDVAPDVKMIKRCELPQESENLSILHASGGQSRGKNGAAYHPLSFSPSTLESGCGKLLPSVPTPVICPTPLRGSVVPVTLQHVISANGSVVSNQPHPVAIQDAGLSSVGRHAPPVPIQGSYTLNGSTVTQASGNQESVNAQGDQNQSVGEGSQPGAPFENLVTEVITRIQHPTRADGNQNESSKSAGKSSSTLDDEVSDADGQPLFVEPLQMLQPVLPSHPNLVPPQSDKDRSTKMNQLLQENAAGNVPLHSE